MTWRFDNRKSPYLLRDIILKPHSLWRPRIRRTNENHRTSSV